MNLYSKYILPKVLNRTMQSESMRRLRPQTISNASGIVLEIGFGSGLNLPHYDNIEKLYALDPSRELFALSKKEIDAAPFPITHINASAEAIPLADNSIDTVVSTWSLCSIPNPEIALREIHRVLKPTGRFAFVEHGQSPSTTLRYIQKFLTPLSKALAGGCHLDRDIEHLIKQVGFNIEKLSKFPQKGKPLAFMYQGIARKYVTH